MAGFITNKSIADKMNRILLSLQWIYTRTITEQDVQYDYKNNAVTFLLRDATTRFEVLAQTCLFFALLNYAHEFYDFDTRNVTIKDEDGIGPEATFTLSYKTNLYEFPDQVDFRARTITNSIFIPAAKYIGDVATCDSYYSAEVNKFACYCVNLFGIRERSDFPDDMKKKIQSICNLLAIDMKAISGELRGDLQMFIYAE